MVSKRGMIRKWFHDALYDEIRKVYLRSSDIDSIRGEIERKVLEHYIDGTKRRWRYDGLNQDGIRFIREVAIAATKSTKGKIYEAFLKPKQWELHSKDSSIPYVLQVEPSLYACAVHSDNPAFPAIEGFRNDVDVALEFWRNGSNMETPKGDKRVEFFVINVDGLVTEQTSDPILTVIAQHDSCARVFSRLMSWALILVILSYTFVTFVYHVCHLLPMLLATGW